LRADKVEVAEPAARDRGSQIASGIARGAMVIAAITVFSRIIGLARTLVFSQVIGATCLGSAYMTAFQVPSLIAELALGGALTSAMIPVLARSAARADVDPEEKARVGQICSAVLTWAIVILGPLAIAIAVLASPIASALTPANVHASCPRGDEVRITADMIRVFAPQIVLYGVSVRRTGPGADTGQLRAHRLVFHLRDRRPGSSARADVRPG
jgi:putative peptidoglycan lipid II flippase